MTDQYDPAQEIGFEGDEEAEPEFRHHILDAAAHHAGYGPHPGRPRKSHHHICEREDQLDREIPAAVDLARLREDREQMSEVQGQKPIMSEDNHQKNNQEKKPRESFEAFCKRLGIKHNARQGGVEISPYRGGNLLGKKPKKTSKS
jgi:hypothetical protein